MNHQNRFQIQDHLNRRVFLKGGASALGAAAMASLAGKPAWGRQDHFPALLRAPNA